MSKTARWQDDADFVKAAILGGDWEIGLRVARSCLPDLPSNTNMVRGARVTLTTFASRAGISRFTAARYWKTWEYAASKGRVHKATTLLPDDEYDWAKSELTHKEWAKFYRKAITEPETAAKRKKREDRERAIAEAAAAQAREEALAEGADEEEAEEEAATAAAVVSAKTDSMDDWSALTIKFDAAKRNLQQVLTLALNIRGFAETEGMRDSTLERVAEVRNILDAIAGAAHGESLDDGLRRILEGSVE